MCPFNDSGKYKVNVKLGTIVKGQIVVTSRVGYINTITHIEKCFGGRDSLIRENN